MFCLLGLITTWASTFAQSTQQIQLSIGDEMPAFNYSKWIKGTPIASFDDDKTYVFEFWATWCAPCVAAMPHLSTLAKQYAGEVEVIGINVWEKVGEDPYESALTQVEQFVEGSGERMDYHVVMDNNELDFVNHWLKPAGINGIPSTFIVKNRTIQWIGHPNRMDSVLAEIVENRFDRERFKKEYEKSQLKSIQNQEQVASIFLRAKEAAKDDNMEEAFQLLDSLVASNSIYASSVILTKFSLLLDYQTEADALKFYNEEMEGKNQMNLMMGDFINKSNKRLSQETYQFAAKEVAKTKSEFSLQSSLLADLYAKAGNFTAAQESIKEAIALGQKELGDPKFEGRVFQHTIDAYKAKLEEFEKQHTP